MELKIGDKVVVYAGGVVEGVAYNYLTKKNEYTVKYRSIGGDMIGYAVVDDSLIEKLEVKA